MRERFLLRSRITHYASQFSTISHIAVTSKGSKDEKRDGKTESSRSSTANYSHPGHCMPACSHRSRSDYSRELSIRSHETGEGALGRVSQNSEATARFPRW